MTCCGSLCVEVMQRPRCEGWSSRQNYFGEDLVRIRLHNVQPASTRESACPRTGAPVGPGRLMKRIGTRADEALAG